MDFPVNICRVFDIPFGEVEWQQMLHPGSIGDLRARAGSEMAGALRLVDVLQHERGFAEKAVSPLCQRHEAPVIFRGVAEIGGVHQLVTRIDQ